MRQKQQRCAVHTDTPSHLKISGKQNPPSLFYKNVFLFFYYLSSILEYFSLLQFYRCTHSTIVQLPLYIEANLSPPPMAPLLYLFLDGGRRILLCQRAHQ